MKFFKSLHGSRKQTNKKKQGKKNRIAFETKANEKSLQRQQQKQTKKILIKLMTSYNKWDFLAGALWAEIRQIIN